MRLAISTSLLRLTGLFWLSLPCWLFTRLGLAGLSGCRRVAFNGGLLTVFLCHAFCCLLQVLQRFANAVTNFTGDWIGRISQPLSGLCSQLPGTTELPGRLLGRLTSLLHLSLLHVTSSLSATVGALLGRL